MDLGGNFRGAAPEGREERERERGGERKEKERGGGRKEKGGEEKERQGRKGGAGERGRVKRIQNFGIL